MKNNKIKEIILFILIALLFASNILIREVNNLDELWNYNCASNIANGLIPYKDFNMVVTPMFSIISGIIIKILGKELVIFRILNILLSTSIVFMTYKIMNKLGIKYYINYFFIIILTYVYYKYTMFDYNYAVAFISLIIVYLEIKNNTTENLLNKDKNKWYYNFIIGILAGLCITIKQTTGIIISIVAIGYKLLDVRSKDDFKEFIKIALWRILGVIIPVVIILIYLFLNNAFDEFLDYCIYGITTFSNKISYIQRLIIKSKPLIKIFAISPIFLLYLIWRYIKNKDKNSLILFCFGIATLVVVYPISDETHLMAGIFVTIISLAYIIDKFIKKEYLVVKIFLGVFSILFVIYQVFLSLQTYISSNKNWELEHYKGLIIKQNIIDSITEIDNYIINSDKKVYILDASSAFYMIPINIYNKNYDMFLLGNLGKRGEQGQIDDLKKEIPNIKVLIKIDKYLRNWQNPENVRKWVIKNMSRQGEIGVYDIYE